MGVCVCMWVGGWVGVCLCVGVCVCVCVFLTYLSRKQIASFRCHIALSSVACLDVPYISILSHKWYDFRKKSIEYETCFNFLYNLFGNILHSKKNSAR